MKTASAGTANARPLAKEPSHPAPASALAILRFPGPAEVLEVVDSLLLRISRSNLRTEKQLNECLEEPLHEFAPQVAVVSGERFRDLLFPWLEPAALRQTDEQLQALLQQLRVQERLSEAGVRFLMTVSGYTYQAPQSGLFGCGQICFGLSVGERKSELQAQLWDLSNRELVTGVAASATGHLIVGGFIIPGYFKPNTEKAVCADIARQIAPLLAR